MSKLTFTFKIKQQGRQGLWHDIIIIIITGCLLYYRIMLRISRSIFKSRHYAVRSTSLFHFVWMFMCSHGALCRIKSASHVIKASFIQSCAAGKLTSLTTDIIQVMLEASSVYFLKASIWQQRRKFTSTNPKCHGGIYWVDTVFWY